MSRLEELARGLVRQPMKRVALEARVMRPYRARRFYAFGERSIVHRPLWIYGPHQMSFGSDVLVLAGTWLSVESFAWHMPQPVLKVGDRVGIRPYCMISASESIVIEDDVIIGAFSSVIDSDHTFSAGRPNVMHNPVATAPVRIGRGTWLAERVAVLRGSDIGECCIIGANSVVRGEIPPYSIAVGSPARVVGRVEGVDARAHPTHHSLW
jgi:acetyltransferase-like isoleucine patch superfamily enzyme